MKHVSLRQLEVMLTQNQSIQQQAETETDDNFHLILRHTVGYMELDEYELVKELGIRFYMIERYKHNEARPAVAVRKKIYKWLENKILEAMKPHLDELLVRESQ